VPANVSCVGGLPSRKRTRSKFDQRGFWLFDLLQALWLIATSYIVGVFVYLVLIRLSELPHGPLWPEEFRAPLAFILIVAATVVIMIPYFQKEWDRGLRMFSIFTALFLLAFATLSTTGLVDPKIPLNFISHWIVEPLRRFLRF